MRVTLDTNVLVSATFWYGDSNEIIKKVENKEFELVLSKAIIDEFVEVLNSEEIQEKITNKNLEMKRTVQKIVSLSSIIEPRINLDVIKHDPNDNKVLECAKEGKVDFIISSDNHLLKLKNFEGIKIITPRDFINS